MKFKMTSTQLIVATALFLVFFDNVAFFEHVTQVYEISISNSGFLLSLGVILASVIALLVTLLSSRYTLKALLIAFVLIASLTNYFMNTYNVILDDTMIQNAMETNVHESMDLINLKLLGYLLVLGVLPSIVIYRIPVAYGSFKEEVWKKLKSIAIVIVLSLVMLFAFNRFYTSFFRENKPLRYYTNPTFCLFSAGSYAYDSFYKKEATLQQIGLDAKKEENGTRKLTIVVVGETARANRFSLNGYDRQTNPLLQKEDVINLSNVYSCGTSTAISVPCMFSGLERKNYTDKEAKARENVIDVLKHSGVSVLWRDNNSDSKGVALRVEYQDYKTSQNNTMCEGDECRDEGMLVGLQEYVNAQKGDIMIVLHQMGNHGPAYYKRYPKSFEKFTPACQTNQVEKCSAEEIGNAYDNAILYTDYFLAKTISFLKQNDQNFQTAMIYMSDHGESLGEKGLYLHGIPYFMAPDEQTHIGALMWFGLKSKERINTQSLAQKASQEYSHDNLFHTILGVMGVQTALYDKTKDILIYQKK